MTVPGDPEFLDLRRVIESLQRIATIVETCPESPRRLVVDKGAHILLDDLDDKISLRIGEP